MDEQAQRRWRDRLARAMARRIEVPPQEEASPSGPPTGWLKDVEGLKAGPPADWVEFVRRNARNAPARMANRSPAPRPAPAESPAPRPSLPAARAEGTPFLPGTPTSPKGWPFMGEFQAVPRAEQRAETPRAPAIEMPGVAAPRGVPAPAFQELPVKRPVPRFEPREVPLFVPPRSVVPEQVPHPGPQVHPLASRAEGHDPAEPERTRADGPRVPRTLEPTTPRPRHSEVRSAVAAEPRERSTAAYPWSEEPAVERRAAPEPEPQEELSTLIERSWPDLAEKEERQPAQPPSAPPERPEIRWSGPWPDLPEAPPSELAEAGALLRQWERLGLLDREQRGE